MDLLVIAILGGFFIFVLRKVGRMKKNVKEGDVLKINKKCLESLEIVGEKQRDVSIAIDDLNNKARVLNTMLFDEMFKIYPQLKEFSLSYNPVEKAVTINRKYTKEESIDAEKRHNELMRYVTIKIEKKKS